LSFVSYFQLTVTCEGEAQEAVANFLFELGCEGCQEGAAHIIGYFPATVDQRLISSRVEQYLAELAELRLFSGRAGLTWQKVPEIDWSSHWKKYFKPLVISEKFTVKPTWETLPAPQTEFVLEIDPKQAFGTGTHATTILMVQLLEQQALQNKSLLDVGTGTGILAIAAKMLGAASIVATDIDPLAIEASVENSDLNLMEGHGILFTMQELVNLKSATGYDFIIANITRKALFALLNDFVRLSAEGAVWLLSGILIEEVDMVRNDLLKYPMLKIVQEVRREEWLALVLKVV